MVFRYRGRRSAEYLHDGSEEEQPSVATYEDSVTCSSKTGKCSVATVGWGRLQEMGGFRDCQRTEDAAPPRLELVPFGPHRKQDWSRRLDWRKLRTATLAALKRPARGGALLFIFCILVIGCNFRRGGPGPSIEFTRVPPAAEGSSDKLDIIEGRVIGGHAGQQIVLYTKNGTWWVQPIVSEEFTGIKPDATWTNSTHVGTEYAALLVEPGYHPPATMSVLPSPDGGVVAVAVAKGRSTGSAVSKTLLFSGYEWRIRDAPSDRGGKNNYKPDNAWTDPGGALHLRIAKASGEWTCAEVTLTRSFGYGTYSFVVRDTSQLDPAAVFTMFTWDYAGTDQNHREMDIEVSRWGDPISKNAQYVVQPFYVPENASRFAAPSGVLTYSIRWEPGRATFRTVRGPVAGSKTSLVAEHVFTSGVPTPGVESARMNLYIFRSAKKPLESGAEVVIEKFEYLP